MKQQILSRESDAQCCGCGACEAVCPVNAIKMIPQEFGALYPYVDDQKCIGCRQCERVCVFKADEPRNGAPSNVYAAVCSDSGVLEKSASGGVFASLAQYFLAQKGVVYGCSMELRDNKLVPLHVGVDSAGDLYKLQGSKYVQSNVSHCFREIKEYLKQGRKVLFSGTPCQVAAMKSFLSNVETDNLYTVDLICHGTPGTALFQEYIALLEKQKKGKVNAFSFRDKCYGWGLTASFEYVTGRSIKKKQVLTPETSSYYSLFLRSETYRESCYSCPWAKQERVGDITLGDYWGVEAEHPEYLTENGGKLNVQSGVSQVIVNTPKGAQLLDICGGGIVLEKSDIQKAAKWNRQLSEPSSHTEERDSILRCYRQNGYAGVEKHFRKQAGIKYYVRILKNKLRELRCCSNRAN